MRLTVEHLSKNYGEKEVLKDVSFQFEKGKIYGLLGKNGSGKTTFFNCLNRDIKMTGGEFYLQEGDEKHPVMPEDIGYVLSVPAVPEFLTGREFLKFFLEINRESVPEPRSLDEYFDMVNIGMQDRDRLLKDYSHGMKNKMQMLVNIIIQPFIFLLDEPLTSLDVVASEEMKQLLRDIKENCIIIFSTHIMDLALDLCDEIVLLNHGMLELIHASNLDNGEFKNRIIAALKEESHD